MNVLVTGSSGFLGQYVVRHLLDKGHHVKAMVRPAADVRNIDWFGHPSVGIVRCDLRRPVGLGKILVGVDVVVHLAASKVCSLHAQLAGTVLATENLLEVMCQCQIRRFVLVSSFAVYDYMARSCRIDERSGLEPNPQCRDEYCQTKLFQEELVRTRCDSMGLEWVVLRPGAIFGAEHLWTARIGMGLPGGRNVMIGGSAKLPLTYVDHCAEAVALAANCPEAAQHILNVVDDEPVTQSEYCRMIRDFDPALGCCRSIPWGLWCLIMRMGELANRLLFRGKAKMPGVLVRHKAFARFRPMEYPNAFAKTVLGWSPRRNLAESLAHAKSEMVAT